MTVVLISRVPRCPLPTVKHASIVGNVHSRLAIENVRAVMIRELYQRTSDSHTEWLKCKMEIPKEYINPKYYADFQRRYRYEIKKHHTTHKQKSASRKTRVEQGYHVTETQRSYQETSYKNVTVENGKPSLFCTVQVILIRVWKVYAPSIAQTEWLALIIFSLMCDRNHQVPLL